MTNIRKQVGEVFGIAIGDGEWEDIWSSLDRENRLNIKHINKLLLVVFKYLEEKENEK